MGALADSVRRHGPASRATCHDCLLPSPLAALRAMANGRTEVWGGPVSQGPACGDLADREHACKHRHGPTCHQDAATPWLAKPRALLLPVPSCWVPLTLPAALRPVARSPPALLDPLLLQTSAAALHALTLAPTDLGGPSGMVGVRPPLDPGEGVSSAWP